MDKEETQKANNGLSRNLIVVLTVIGVFSQIPHKPLDAISTILFSCAALMIIFYPVIMLVERVKTKGVRIGNWTVYRLYPIYFKSTIACFGIVFLLLSFVLIYQSYQLL